MRRLGSAALFAMTILACLPSRAENRSTFSGALASTAQPMQLAQATIFDGTYNGTIQLLPNGHPTCRGSQPVIITVANNRLRYTHFGGNVVYDTPVKLDGTFSDWGRNVVSGLPQSLTGRIAGDTIEADTGTSACSYHLSLKKG
jgi:hypothetical protein